MNFFKTTESMKKLIILAEIQSNESINHIELAKAAGISPAMVNNYIRNLQNEHYIVPQGNNKRRSYLVTGRGHNYYKYLLISCMAEVMQFAGSVSRNIRSIILELVGESRSKVYLYGAGETGRVCAQIARDIPQLEVLGFIDDDINLVGKTFQGHRVFSLAEALAGSYDKIVITTFLDNEVILKRLATHVDPQKVLSLSNSSALKLVPQTFKSKVSEEM